MTAGHIGRDLHVPEKHRLDLRSELLILGENAELAVQPHRADQVEDLPLRFASLWRAARS